MSEETTYIHGSADNANGLLESSNCVIIKNIKYYHKKFDGLLDERQKLLFNLHWHPYIEIIKIVSGCANFCVNNKTYILNGGDVLLINSGDMHSAVVNLQNSDHFEYNAVQINPGLFNIYLCREINKKFIEPLLDNKVNSTFCFRSGASEKAWNRICIAEVDNLIDEIIRVDNTADETVALSAVYSFASIINVMQSYGMINENSSRENEEICTLKNVLSYIDANFGEKIEIAELAAAAYMSVDNFYKFFKQKTRCTPVDYINHIRVEKAAKLLESEPNMSIFDILMQCGFNHQSYFTKTFRKYKSMTPSQYREFLQNR